MQTHTLGTSRPHNTLVGAKYNSQIQMAHSYLSLECVSGILYRKFRSMNGMKTIDVAIVVQCCSCSDNEMV